jgi:hypothetical protein
MVESLSSSNSSFTALERAAVAQLKETTQENTALGENAEQKFFTSFGEGNNRFAKISANDAGKSNRLIKVLTDESEKDQAFSEVLTSGTRDKTFEVSMNTNFIDAQVNLSKLEADKAYKAAEESS